MKWTIRFRKIAEYDYFTPIMYIPIEETCVEGETAKEAWETFVTGPYAGNRDSYQLVEITERNL